MELLLPEMKDTARYGGEPYVLAADVSAAPGHEGEAGWTWYTGSSGWAFRVLTREILGLQRRGGRIEVSPRSALPDGCRVRLDGEQLLPAP